MDMRQDIQEVQVVMAFLRKNVTGVVAVVCLYLGMPALGAAEVGGSKPGPAYSLVYLGDLHFDRCTRRSGAGIPTRDRRGTADNPRA